MRRRSASVVVLLLALGCAGRAPPIDGGEGEGEGEGALPPPPPPTCPDDGGGPAPGDTSLAGTPFQDVAIAWPATLTLCSTWTEGGAVDDERAKKARVIIPPQARPSFGRQDLANATLAGVRIERGVLASERFETSACKGDAVVDQWAVDDTNAQFVVLRATVRYSFGAAGDVVENVSIVSQDGAPPGPVTYGAQSASGGVAFGWEDPSAGVSTLISACDGSEALNGDAYGAVEVIVGHERGGARGLAVVRALRTEDAFAGSYPVFWQSTVVARSDAPFDFARARDFWAQTYAAQHHNWEETSRIDFDRDVVAYHAFFAPDATSTSGTAVKTVSLSGVNGFSGQASIDVVTRDLASGAETTTTYDVNDPIRRVDATSLGRGLTCPGGAAGDVRALGVIGADAAVVQVLTCPRAAAPGYAVTAIVPVLMSSNVDVLGQAVEAIDEVTVDGHPGFHATIGGASVTVSDYGASGMRLDVDDGGPFPTSFLATPARLDDIPLDPDGVQRFASDDGTVQLTITTRTLGQGAGISTIFAPVATELLLPEQRFFTDAYDAQHYHSTHHNWADTLDADAGGAHISWSVTTDFNQADFLIYTVSAGDLLPPTRVHLVP